MLTTIERVRLLSDEFTSIPDDRLTMYIEDASSEVSFLNAPEQYQERLARYLTAHLALMSTAAPQAIIREKVDVIERQYSDPSKNTGLFASKYGQEYQRLLDEVEQAALAKKGVNLVVF